MNGRHLLVQKMFRLFEITEYQKKCFVYLVMILTGAVVQNVAKYRHRFTPQRRRT